MRKLLSKAVTDHCSGTRDWYAFRLTSFDITLAVRIFIAIRKPWLKSPCYLPLAEYPYLLVPHEQAGLEETSRSACSGAQHSSTNACCRGKVTDCVRECLQYVKSHTEGQQRVLPEATARSHGGAEVSLRL